MKKCTVIVLLGFLLSSSLWAVAGWTAATPAAPWVPRHCGTCAVFQNELWMIGGSTASNDLNDVWYTTDGVNWTPAALAAAWTPRQREAAVVFHDSLWVLGGGMGTTMLNDVWVSADGANWSEVTAHAGWVGRKGHIGIVYHDSIFVFGGTAGNAVKNDVWASADGVSWVRVDSAAPWAARGGHMSVVWNDTIWMMGGCPAGGTIYKNDVWKTADGANWIRVDSAASWMGRRGGSVFVMHDTLWLMGGNNASTYFNDVWYTIDGANWRATASANWAPRWDFGSGLYDDHMWVFGGWTTSSVLYNDVWFSVVPLTGYWTQMSNVPVNAKGKTVKDGAALAYGKEATDTGYVYALKGNNTYEFYRYNTATGAWFTRETIPARNRLLKKKAVKKGSSLVMATDGKLYATKGGNTVEFWQFEPLSQVWTQKADVPPGTKKCKEGTSSAAVRFDSTSYVYLLKGSNTYEFYRYNTGTDAWDMSLAQPPSGTSGRAYRIGSSITYDGGDTIYCLKGSCNEFFAYSISGNNWVTKETLPKRWPYTTRKNKVLDGSQISYAGGIVYALKGGNTNEFWAYLCDTDLWFNAAPLTPGSKMVKGGGALVAAKRVNSLYAFRGNGTLEFWMFGPVAFGSFAVPGHNEFQSVMSSGRQAVSGIRLRVTPNPFVQRTCVDYSLPRTGMVSLKLYDVSGALKAVLAHGCAAAGSHSVFLNADNLARGIYLLKFEGEAGITTSKLIIE